MLKKVLSIMMIIPLLVGCSFKEQQNTIGNTQATESTQNAESNLNVEVIAENLEVPWSIEKEGDTIYLSERPGAIIRIENGKVDRQKVELKNRLSTASEAGLLGFVLAPDFQESKSAFAYYTYEDNSEQFNRIVTLRLDDGVWRENNVLLDRIPSGPAHHGGRLEFGPDGKLYATAGDAYRSEVAQDLDSLGGKILRINLDGSVPSDNPYPNSYVYSYGHRNPQGLAWSPDGKLYASEHGNSQNDEINHIKSGQNYGWPIIEGYEEKSRMVSPLYTSGNASTWAPSGMDYDNNKLYVGALRGTAVLEFDLKTGESRSVITGLGRIRDVRIKDTYLYFISNNSDGRGDLQENDDKLYRISLAAPAFGP